MAKSNKDYDPHSIEKKWREKWEESKIYQPDLDKARKPFYNLMMFPYPSAEGLHVGSVFTFTGVDTYGRFKRMQGFDVFEPMGLDGFGIHSENYALKVGRHPRQQAKISEENFYRQLKSIGNGFDWSRKVETYDPAYYKWTQWIFIQLFKRGLAYRKKAPVNFCPKDLTVLADEQVIDGKCERCSSIVEKRELEQWFFKITDYADRLLNNIPKLNWTNKVKIAQEQWIGRSEGLIEKWKVDGMDLELETFTTWPHTTWGATFMVIAPEHPVIEKLVKGTKYEAGAKKFVEEVKKDKVRDPKSLEKEKKGFFLGRYVINHLAGHKMPLYIANFAVMEYGTGIVKCTPTHDQRDFEFAKKYKLPFILVVRPKGSNLQVENLKEAYVGSGVMTENTGPFEGMPDDKAREAVAEHSIKLGHARKAVNYHLRDWLISRQRYWGPPIPMIHCKKCEWQPVPEKDLPVLLPDVKDWRPQGSGTSPLANHPEFYNTTCPKCQGKARRETDVSDTFLDSSWYFFRYLATDVKEQPLHIGRNKRWLPVTMYIGGAEHSVLHLLYSRFITMVFHDMGLCDFEEPYRRFYAHGLIIKEGRKMSKSRGNVVNPDDYLAKYGVDTLRAYLRFVGPFDMGGDFRDSGIEGMHRFLKRVWKLVQEVSSEEKNGEENLEREMYQAIKKVTEDLENLRFNTAIARLMEYYNTLSDFHTKYRILDTKYCKTLVLLLAPFTPFLAEELWERMGQKYSVHQQPWPKYDPKILLEEEVTVVVQVDGKVRDTIKVESSKLKVQSFIEEEAAKQDRIKKHLEGKKIKKTIFVPGKIINFVTLS